MAISVKEKKIAKTNLQKIFAATFGRNINYEKATIQDVSQWDSIKGVELLLAVEESFKLTLSEKDLEKFTSFQKIYAIIIKKL